MEIAGESWCWELHVPQLCNQGTVTSWPVSLLRNLALGGVARQALPWDGSVGGADTCSLLWSRPWKRQQCLCWCGKQRNPGFMGAEPRREQNTGLQCYLPAVCGATSHLRPLRQASCQLLNKLHSNLHNSCHSHFVSHPEGAYPWHAWEAVSRSKNGADAASFALPGIMICEAASSGRFEWNYAQALFSRSRTLSKDALFQPEPQKWWK